MIVSKTENILREYLPESQTFEKEDSLVINVECTSVLKKVSPKGITSFKLFLNDNTFFKDLNVCFQFHHRFQYKPVKEYITLVTDKDIHGDTHDDIHGDIQDHKFFLIEVRITKRLYVVYKLLDSSKNLCIHLNSLTC